MELATKTLEYFRLDTRQWIEENYPDALIAPLATGELTAGGRKATFFHPDAKLWLDRMADKVVRDSIAR